LEGALTLEGRRGTEGKQGMARRILEGRRVLYQRGQRRTRRTKKPPKAGPVFGAKSRIGKGKKREREMVAGGR